MYMPMSVLIKYIYAQTRIQDSNWESGGAYTSIYANCSVLYYYLSNIADLNEYFQWNHKFGIP